MKKGVVRREMIEDDSNPYNITVRSADGESEYDPQYHYHEVMHEIRYIVEGEGETVINGKTYPIGKNDFLIYPKGAEHMLYGTFGSRYTVTFTERVWTDEKDRAFFSSFLYNLDDNQKVVNLYDSSYLFPVPGLIKELLKEVKEQREDIDIAFRLRLMEMLLCFNRWHASAEAKKDGEQKERRSTSEERMATLLAYIKENSHKDLHLDNVVAMSGLSARQFTRIFRKMTNRTFRAYLNMFRIQNAVHLIEESIGAGSERKIISIAFEVGYDDISTFYRAFKKETGYTPKQFINTTASVG